MEGADVSSRRKGEIECLMKTTKPRRLSGSNLTSFREDYRNAANISSTVSSPGYISRDQIDPSRYSFSTALKSLQRRSTNGREYLSFKWNEAEKYISNPYSGEVPRECLASKAQFGRARPASERLTRSGPLSFSNAHLVQIKPSRKCEATQPKSEEVDKLNVKRKKDPTKSVGIQSSLPGFDFSNSSNSSLGTTIPPKESSFTSCNSGESDSSSFNEKPATRVKDEAVKENHKEEMELCNEEAEAKKICKYKSWICLPWIMWPRIEKRQDFASISSGDSIVKSVCSCPRRDCLSSWLVIVNSNERQCNFVEACHFSYINESSKINSSS